MGSDYLSGRPLQPFQGKELKLPKWPPGSLARVRQQGAHQSFCCPQSPRDYWDMDNAGLFVLIFMGKGIGVVFPYGVLGLSFYVINKQSSYNNLGGVWYIILWFHWFFWLLCKTIPQHTWKIFQKLGPTWTHTETLCSGDENLSCQMWEATEQGQCHSRHLQMLPPEKLAGHHMGREHAGSQTVFLATLVS